MFLSIRLMCNLNKTFGFTNGMRKIPFLPLIDRQVFTPAA